MRVALRSIFLAVFLMGCTEWCPTHTPALTDASGENDFESAANGEAAPEPQPRITQAQQSKTRAVQADSAFISAPPTPIRPHPSKPNYWEYNGRLVILLGGSKNDNLFQSDSLEEHLDLLTSVGGNYIRNTMSSRDPGDIWAYHRRSDGMYDLERFNDAYFKRFERLLQLAYERDIIVQIELWDRFDFGPRYAGGTGWVANPYRPANNINYTTQQSGLANVYEEHPDRNENPFFRTIPAEDNNTMLLRYQHAYVDTLLEISLRYPNVLYTMDNETSASEDWGAYWAEFVQQKARHVGVPVYTTEMWDAWDLKHEQHRRTLDNPDLYAFADISQNNQNKDQEHWDNLQWVRAYTSNHPRPLNHVKTYGADTGRFGSTQDGLERFWRSLLGGAASVRFHRPPNGLGLSHTAQAHLRSARMLLDVFDLASAVPDAESGRLSARYTDEAYLTYVEGSSYAVYFTEGGSVKLDLCDTDGPFDVNWLDLSRSKWGMASTVEGRGFIRLDAPGDGHWIALLSKSVSASDKGDDNGEVGGRVLEQNHPNPFSFTTTSRYGWPSCRWCVSRITAPSARA